MPDSSEQSGGLKETKRTASAAPPRTSSPVALEYARERAGAFRRWVVRTFTTENIGSTFKTLAWVVPLTILIWVYAEREQTFRMPDVTIPISIKSSDPTRIVTPLMKDSAVRAELIGPRAQVERVIEMISRPGDSPIVQIQVDPRNYRVGKESSLTTAQVVGDHSVFKTMGVTVRDCKPAGLPIFVDAIADREVEVQIPQNITNLASAAFEPKTVKVHGPKGLLDVGGLQVTADLARRQELRTPGPHELASVPLTCSIDDPSITIQPPTVKALLDVNQADATLTIQSMPVWTTGPPRLLQKYRVEADDTVPNVKVIGPPDKIEMLKSANFEPKPVARLVVKQEDVGKPPSERKLQYDLPTGVRVSREDENKTIRFRLVELGANE